MKKLIALFLAAWIGALYVDSDVLTADISLVQPDVVTVNKPSTSTAEGFLQTLHRTPSLNLLEPFRDRGINAYGLSMRTAALDTTELDSFIVEIMESEHIPGLAACAIKDGEIIWTGAYGYAYVENETKVADTTLFTLASVSKTITATALMQLWENGWFDLDEDINNFLPFEVTNPNCPDTAITFRMLLTHTSSIAGNSEISLSWFVTGDYPMPLSEVMHEFFVPGVRGLATSILT
jgi:CubicO group peptidase (beta-lactamase class C family)